MLLLMLLLLLLLLLRARVLVGVLVRVLVALRLGDRNLNMAINGEMVLSGELGRAVANGDKVTVFPMIAGG